MADKPEVIVARCLRDFEEDEIVHRQFVSKVRQRYDAYRGVLDIGSEAAAWTSRQAPKYILQVIETQVANLLDPSPVWRLRARPRLDSPEQVERYQNGARANELLLAEQLECDHYAEKQRSYGLQGLITGLSVKKNSWGYKEATVREQQVIDEPVYFNGIEVSSRPVLRAVAREKVPVRDDPTSEVINVEDFIWHQAAVSLEKCLRVTHRVWYSFDELEELVRLGVYGTKAGGESIDPLKESRDQTGSLEGRDRELHYGADRTKDMIEVLECWVDHGQRVVSIANRKVLLADRPNPFWFDRLQHPYPFVVCSAMPDLFVIPGISEVEVMLDIQEMLWSMLNQQIDAQQLMANVITLVRDDVDTRNFEWAPGEYWSVPDLEALKPLEINPMVGELTTATMQRLKDDLQNIPGASPTLLGQVDPSTQTATEVSLTTSMAQRRMLSKKMQFSWSQRRDGEQWIALNQQFIRDTRMIEILGNDGAREFEEIRPEMLQGTYSIELAAMDESLMRQERRAEKTALLQTVIQALPAFAALAQVNPKIQMPNPQALLDDVFEAYGITGDKARYYTAIAPPAGAMPPPQQGAQPPANGAAPAPGGADPMQQLLAMSGGAVNQLG